MDKVNGGGYVAKDTSSPIVGSIFGDQMGGLHLGGQLGGPVFDVPAITDQSLCRRYQELLRCNDADAEWKFMDVLENFLLSSNPLFSSFYRRSGAPRQCTGGSKLQKRSFFQKLFPKLKEIPITVGIQVDFTSPEPYGYIVVYVPFMTNTKHITLRLHSSEALIVGDFPLSDTALNWVTIEADKIDFIHPIVPVGLRPFVAASLATVYGWAGAQHEACQLLLEKSPRR